MNIPHFKTTRNAALAAVLAIALPSTVLSQISWDYSWDGSVLPTANPGAAFAQQANTPSYTATYSDNHPLYDGSDTQTEVVTLTDTLNAGGTYTIDTHAVYQTALSYRNTAQWTGWDPGNYSAIEMRLRVDEQYPQHNATSIYTDQQRASAQRYAQFFRLLGDFDASSAEGRYAFFLRDTNVGFGTADQVGSDNLNYAVDMSEFQTFRIFLFDDKAELYHFNTTTSEFDLVMTNTTHFIAAAGGPVGPMLEFGDIGTGFGNGEVTYDYIQWANNIPEPSSVVLVALTGLALLLSRRVRREA